MVSQRLAGDAGIVIMDTRCAAGAPVGIQRLMTLQAKLFPSGTANWSRLIGRACISCDEVVSGLVHWS